MIYRYPPVLKHEMAKERSRRRWFWLAILLIFAGGSSTAVIQDAWELGLFGFGFGCLIVLLFEGHFRSFERDTNRLLDTEVHVDGNELRLVATSDQSLIGRIRLDLPFTASMGNYVAGNAVYEVKQGFERLLISSRINHAEDLIKGVLKATWPPGGD